MRDRDSSKILAVIGIIVAVFFGLVQWLFSFEAVGPSPIKPGVNEMPSAVPIELVDHTSISTNPTVTIQPVQTAFPTSEQVETFDLTIPSYQEAGVRFDVPRNGTYKITFVGGAYSPYAIDNGNDNKWRTILRIYKNREIEWGKRFTLIEPINSDFQLGDFETGNPTQEEAEARVKGTYVSLSLNMGDYLIIVAVDEKGSYLFEGKNRGDVYVQITLPSK